MKASTVLLVIAVVCFVLAAADVTVGTIGLLPLGLAFFAGSFLANRA
jgi:hypothetical protein